MTYRVVRAVKDSSVKKFIFMSSISAYGDCGKLIKETNPRSKILRCAKAAGEFVII
jgi:nucleoside-diphosphate-sugar epimerase